MQQKDYGYLDFLPAMQSFDMVGKIVNEQYGENAWESRRCE